MPQLLLLQKTDDQVLRPAAAAGPSERDEGGALEGELDFLLGRGHLPQTGAADDAIALGSAALRIGRQGVLKTGAE